VVNSGIDNNGNEIAIKSLQDRLMVLCLRLARQILWAADDNNHVAIFG